MAASVGKVLRDARVERGIELEEVERATKIRVKFLLAMEQDEWGELPGAPYTQSFLSTYARFLGLDADALVEEYKRTAEPPEPAEPVPRTAIRPGGLTHPRSVSPAALVAAGLVAVVALGLVIAVSLGGSGNGGGSGKTQTAARSNGGATTAPSSESSTTAPSTTTASEVSLELRATDVVWVCVVDSRGTAVVPGETLDADETRGPFSSRSFEINVGNGSIAITADGQPVDVPPLAEPLGYRVSPEGTRKLAPSDRPTCA